MGMKKNLPITVPYIIEHLELFENYRVEVIMVNDGSPDNSWEVMKKYQSEYPDLIKIASLSRNFGQMACIHAGMDLAKGASAAEDNMLYPAHSCWLSADTSHFTATLEADA